MLLNGDLMSELTDFRLDKDEFFKHHPQSPFTPEQQQVFTGLEYFPENDDLRLEVTVEKFSDQQPMQMQTSTGGVQAYVRYGRFKFQDRKSTRLNSSHLVNSYAVFSLKKHKT